MVFLEDSLPYLLLRNNSNRLTIVALELGGSAKVVVRQRQPDGSRPRPCPTPRPAGHDAPAIRPARPVAQPRGFPWRAQSGHGALAAAPGADSHRPPRASRHA